MNVTGSPWLTAALTTATLLAGQCNLYADEPAEQAYFVRAMEPSAFDAIKRMGAYLKSLPHLHVSAESNTDQVLDNGQVVQFISHTDVLAVAPDKLRITVSHGPYRKTLFYGARHFYLFDEGQRYYAEGAAAPTINQLLDDMADQYGVVLPLADLLRWDALNPERLGLVSAVHIGDEEIDGHLCAHYAYVMPNTDWQLWVRAGDKPLPCQLVIVRTDVPQMPRHTMRYQWMEEEAAPAEDFKFFPPVGTKAVPMQVIAPRKEDIKP
ncbi:MAG: DUF2092 domain-containing protein [Janthinobacterium lividum]